MKSLKMIKYFKIFVYYAPDTLKIDEDGYPRR